MASKRGCTLFLFLVEFIVIECYPSGAPVGACFTMMPGHGRQFAGDLYGIELSEVSTYTKGIPLSVKVVGRPFQGILMEARRSGRGEEAIGSWSNPPAYIKAINCPRGTNNAVTHSGTRSKPSGTTFIWIPPDIDTGSIYFIATVMSSKNVWNANVTSSILTSGDVVVTNSPISTVSTTIRRVFTTTKPAEENTEYRTYITDIKNISTAPTQMLTTTESGVNNVTNGVKYPNPTVSVGQTSTKETFANDRTSLTDPAYTASDSKADALSEKTATYLFLENVSTKSSRTDVPLNSFFNETSVKTSTGVEAAESSVALSSNANSVTKPFPNGTTETSLTLSTEPDPVKFTTGDNTLNQTFKAYGQTSLKPRIDEQQTSIASFADDTTSNEDSSTIEVPVNSISSVNQQTNETSTVPLNLSRFTTLTDRPTTKVTPSANLNGTTKEFTTFQPGNLTSPATSYTRDSIAIDGSTESGFKPEPSSSGGSSGDGLSTGMFTVRPVTRLEPEIVTSYEMTSISDTVVNNVSLTTSLESKRSKSTFTPEDNNNTLGQVTREPIPNKPDTTGPASSGENQRTDVTTPTTEATSSEGSNSGTKTTQSAKSSTISYEEVLTTTRKVTYHCYPDPCQNGGTCFFRQEAHRGRWFDCLCPLGVGGYLCQYLNVCSDNPCPPGWAFCLPTFFPDSGRMCFDHKWNLIDF